MVVPLDAGSVRMPVEFDLEATKANLLATVKRAASDASARGARVEPRIDGDKSGREFRKSLTPHLQGAKRDVEGSMRGADRAAAAEGDRAGRSFASRFTSSASAIGSTLTRVGAVAASAVGAAGAVGVKTAADNEQAKISFETMLGSARKADTFLRDMKAFAAATPFEMAGLQEASSSLISAGIDSSKVIPIMRTLGDVTSGMGTGAEGIKRATVALQQMNAAQKVSGEDLNQLRDAGIPVYDLLAAATGKSKGEIVKLAQAGKLGKTELDAMMKALESGKGLERFSGLMDKQSQSLTGMVSTLKDTVSQGLADLIQPELPTIKAGLTKVTALFGDALEWTKAHLPTIKATVSDVVTGVQGALSGVDTGAFMSALQGLGGTGGDTLSSLTSGVGSLAQVVTGSLGPAMQGVGIVVGAFSTTTKFLADHMDLVQKVMPGLIAAFAAYKTLQMANNVLGRDSAIGIVGQIAANVALATSNRQLAASYAQMAAAQGTATAASNTSMLTRAREVIGMVAHKVATVASTVATGAATAGQWLLNAALSANPIGIVVVALTALVAGLVIAYQKSETFRAIVQGAWEGIKTAAASVVSWFQTSAVPFLQAVWNAVVAGVRTLVGQFSAAWNAVKAAVLLVWAAIQVGITLYVNAVRTVVTTVWNVIKTATSVVWNAIKAVIVAVWVGIQTAVTLYITAVRTVVSTVWGWIRTATATAWNGIKAVIAAVWAGIQASVSTALAAVRAVIAAVWAGIKATTSAVWGGIKSTISTTWDGIKSVVSVAMAVLQRSLSTAWGKVTGVFNTAKGKIDGIMQGVNNAINSVWSFAGKAATGIGKAWSAVKGAFAGPAEWVSSNVFKKLADAWNGAAGLVKLPKWDYQPIVAKASGGFVPGYSPNDRADNIPAMLTAKEFVTRRWAAMRMRRQHPGALEYINRHGTLPAYADGGNVFDSERPGPHMGGRTSPLRPGEYQKDQGVWRQLKGWLQHNIPGARVTSSFRQTRTATGRISNHARGLAVDIVGSGRTSMMDIFNKILATVGGRSLELIHSPAGGRQIYHGRPHYYSGVTRANHFDHVHWSMPSMDPNTPMATDGEGGVGLPNPFDAVKGVVTKLLDQIPDGGTQWGKALKGIPLALMDKMSSFVAGKLALAGPAPSDDAQGISVPAGSGVQRWSSLVLQALQMVGEPASLLPVVLRRMNQESGGNPRAINNWDSNAKRGTPSKGLMQVIDPTFRSFAMPGYNSNVWDPLSNILASMRYAKSRYGSLAKAYNRKGGYALGGFVRALATGGFVPGFSPNDRADNIPALLTAKEFVTRRWAAMRMRRRHPGALEHINATGTLPGYAAGGTVSKESKGWTSGLSSSATKTSSKKSHATITVPVAPVWTEDVKAILQGDLTKYLQGGKLTAEVETWWQPIADNLKAVSDAAHATVKDSVELGKNLTAANTKVADAQKTLDNKLKTQSASRTKAINDAERTLTRAREDLQRAQGKQSAKARDAVAGVVKAQDELKAAKAIEVTGRTRAAQQKALAAKNRKIKTAEDHLAAARKKADAAGVKNTDTIIAKTRKVEDAQRKVNEARKKGVDVTKERKALADAKTEQKTAQNAVNANKAQAAAAKRVDAVLATYSPKMKALAADLDTVQNKLTWTDPNGKVITGMAALKEHLDGLTAAARSYAEQVAQGVMQKASITALFAGQGESSGGLGAVVSGLKDTIAKTKEYAGLIRGLTSMGLDGGILEQLRGAGLDGLDVARAISQGGPATIAELNGLQRELQSSAEGLGKQFADDVYGSQISAAQSVYNAWKAREDDLTKMMADLGTQMAKAITDAFKANVKIEVPVPSPTTPAVKKPAAPSKADPKRGTQNTKGGAVTVAQTMTPTTLVVVDSDGVLMGSMQVVAEKETTKALAGVGRSAR